MSKYKVNGIEIEIETRGSADAPAFVLIRGLSTQLIHWPETFLGQVVSAGYRAVIFDNRDVGKSTKFDAAGVPSIPDLLSGAATPAYSVADMALDTVGVLDALGIEKAHVAGISLGGMIAQHLAFAHADRFRTVTSIMSSSGAPGLPSGTPEAMEALTSRPEDPNDREGVIAHSMRTQRVISSPGFPPTEAELRSYFERGYDRCYLPEGSARQMAAVLSDATRPDRLAEIQIPFFVVHGSADPLLPLACGEDTAKRVPGAKMEIIEGMGHDITVANSPVVSKLLIDFARAHGPEN
jgi:pimeloyl-ACP methyl ester carboxylesterase